MANITTKKIFFPVNGAGLTLDEVYSLCDYHNRTGEYPEHFTDEDMDSFHKTYIKPNQEINDSHIYQ